MESPELVVLDLDGTVVKHSTQRVGPSAAVVTALAAVQAAGVPVAVATGRAIWSALPTVAELGLSKGLISTSHGALTYDLAADEVVETRTLDPGEAVTRLSLADPSAAFAVELGVSGWRHTHNFRRDFASTWADVVDVATLSATVTTRLAVRLPNGGRYGVGKRCPRATRLSETAALDTTKYYQEIGFNGWIDIGPAGASKASGVAHIARHYGVSPERTIVFGDAANDLSMFAWAGHAVAMGQATAEIKSAANEVAPSVEADGVATVLSRWFT